MSDDRLSEVRFLTVAEVASIMRVSKMTVYRMVHNGELPAVRVGRSFRVPQRAVEEMAALVVYLAAPESTFVTGQAIVIDGGWTL